MNHHRNLPATTSLMDILEVEQGVLSADSMKALLSSTTKRRAKVVKNEKKAENHLPKLTMMKLYNSRHHQCCLRLSSYLSRNHLRMQPHHVFNSNRVLVK